MKSIELGVGERVGLALLAGAFLICRLEWGQTNSAYVFQIFREMAGTREHVINTLTHPLVLAGLAGLGLLGYGALVRYPRRLLVLAGIILPGLIVLFLFFIGLWSGRMAMVLLSLPSLILAGVLLRRVGVAPSP